MNPKHNVDSNRAECDVSVNENIVKIKEYNNLSNFTVRVRWVGLGIWFWFPITTTARS
jgi:hypothetical protein